MNINRRMLLAGVTMVSAISIISIERASATDSFTIGLNYELTGPGASYGLHSKIGAEMAAEELNAAGGINGAKINLVVRDNGTKPQQAVVIVREFATSEAVAIMGPIQTTNARVAFPATNREEIVSISPGSNIPGLAAQNRPWAFRSTALIDLVHRDVFQAFKKDHPKAKKVVVIVDPRDAYSSYVTKSIVPDSLTEAGLDLMNPGAYIEIPYTDQDMSAHVTRVKSMNADAIYLGILFDRGKDFLFEANRQGLKLPIITAAGYDTEDVAAAAKNIELYAGQTFNPNDPSPEVQSFVKAFGERVKKELPGQYTTPTFMDAGGYEVVKMIAKVLTSMNAKPGDNLKTMRMGIRDGLQSMKDFKGLGASITFNKDGDGFKQSIVRKVSNGDWVELTTRR